MNNQWDIRYNTEEFVYGTAPNDFLRETARYIPKGGEVLCLAEGEGRNAVFLAKQGYNVTAVDASAVGLQKAQKLAESNQVSIKTVVADLNDFEIEPQRWDGIVSIFCHLAEPLRSKVYHNAVKGLARNGVLIMEAYTPRQLKHKTGGPPVVELLYEPEEIKTLLTGLDFIIYREVEREIYEGKLHRGLSAVLQVLAKKP
jgi:2-polyprenyl-3-methyl-5-hydroxy-6-metoxy-1,4-benzoquinol methylase